MSRAAAFLTVCAKYITVSYTRLKGKYCEEQSEHVIVGRCGDGVEFLLNCSIGVVDDEEAAVFADV